MGEATGLGAGIQVDTTIAHQGAPVDGANVTLEFTHPLVSLAQVSTPNVVAAAINADKIPIPTGGKTLIPTKTTTATFLPGKKGHYVLELSPVEIDGVYQFTIQATGKACGGTFQRYKHFSRYIGKKLD